jgi:hypothetical protein
MAVNNVSGSCAEDNCIASIATVSAHTTERMKTLRYATTVLLTELAQQVLGPA